VFDREGNEAFLSALQMLKAAEVGGQLANGTATKLFLPSDMGRMFGLTERLATNLTRAEAMQAVAK